MNNDYDLILVHKLLLKMSDADILTLLKCQFPQRDLYQISTDWRDDRKYILKARGARGDVIVGWIENQSCRKSQLSHCPIL